MWGENEWRSEYKFWKYTYEKKLEKNQNNKADYKKKTRKLWKRIVIEGKLFIISRIISWVTFQFFNLNFKSGSRIPASSKVEFIATGTAITVFLVKVWYYLKRRKFESLFYKINICLQKTTTRVGLQAEEIFSVNI